MCKQIGLDTNYAKAATVLKAAYCELDAAKTEYAQLAKATKKKAKDHLLALFALVDPSDPRLIKARSDLANALF